MFVMMSKLKLEEIIQSKYNLLKSEFTEKTKRLWAASESMLLNHGGVAIVSRATGIAESTIRIGRKELNSDTGKKIKENSRIRKVGGGRKNLIDIDKELLSVLEKLVDPSTRGDPMSSLKWTCKSTRNLATELLNKGYTVSHTKVAQLLAYLGYSLQGTRKTKEGSSHPDRNAQFEYINKQVKVFQLNKQPVISVDSKKRELVGDFTNKGSEYQPKRNPEKVRVYDFVDKELGKVTPYGIYDCTTNSGWVSVGIDHNTAQFAVDSIRSWWYKMGISMYSNSTKLLITADNGGSNSGRCRLWKIELQKLANEIGLEISVCHFPPGTSKWNKIEHRMFCHITQNWRGKPLVSYEVIVNLIASTKTKKGLSIKAELNKSKYPKGIKINDKQMEELNIEKADFHGEDWNYTIKNNQKSTS